MIILAAHSAHSVASSNIVTPLAGGVFEVVTLDPNDSAININFEADGDITFTLGGGSAQEWYVGGTPPVTYEIRATLQSGTTPTSGTMNSWLALTSTRIWSNERTTIGIKTSTILFEIRRQSDGVIVTSGTYTITASVEA